MGDVVFSSNKALAFTSCARIGDIPNRPDSLNSNNQKSCRDYYIHTHLYEILCTSQSVLFYKDCAASNAFSLTIIVRYLDWGPYPAYNCLINQANFLCASLCTQLLTSYKLLLVQEFKDNQVQAAWAGLSNFNVMPNIQLTQSSVLNPCSHALKLNSGFQYLILAFFGILFYNFF